MRGKKSNRNSTSSQKPVDMKSKRTFLLRHAVEALEPRRLFSAGVYREVWTGIPGTQISNLTDNAAYPWSPSSSSVLSEFNAPQNEQDNYGQRLRAILTPTQTGNYQFWIAADDRARLFLSSDSSPNHKSQIAEVLSYTGYQDWTVSSQPIYLVQGQQYYIEAIMKEGNGGGQPVCGVEQARD